MERNRRGEEGKGWRRIGKGREWKGRGREGKGGVGREVWEIWPSYLYTKFGAYEMQNQNFQKNAHTLDTKKLTFWAVFLATVRNSGRCANSRLVWFLIANRYVIVCVMFCSTCFFAECEPIF